MPMFKRKLEDITGNTGLGTSECRDAIDMSYSLGPPAKLVRVKSVQPPLSPALSVEQDFVAFPADLCDDFQPLSLPTPVPSSLSFPDQRNRPALLYPLLPPKIIPPHTRALHRKSYESKAAVSDVSTDETAFRGPWKADPSKLQSGKKAKYYGVRIGRQPGIYYSWEDAKAQVDGYPNAVHHSVKASCAAAADIEHYMNHEGQNADTICYNDPGAWLQCIVRKHDLDRDQTNVVSLVAKGRSIFLTGAAGTGKSRVIHAVKQYLKGIDAEVATIAPTGIAALNVEGLTLHSYAGWTGNADRISLKELCGKHARMKKNWMRLNEADVLIIDEISMVDSNALTRLSQMLQAASQWHDKENSKRPFGGKQVLITGDFYQLPPVRPFHCCLYCGQENAGWKERLQTYSCEVHGDFENDDKWAFSSPVWQACSFANVQLTHLHRQFDQSFVNLLNDCRVGLRWTREQEHELLNHSHDVVLDRATKLFPTRDDVKGVNDFHMKRIEAQSYVYCSADHFHWNHKKHPELEYYGERLNGPLSALKELSDAHRYESELEPKRGMLVILTSSLPGDEKLINGSMGTIIGFLEINDHDRPRVQRGSRDQPRRKGQFIYGDHKHYREARVADFCKGLSPPNRKWSVVKFHNGIERIIFASCLVQELGKHKPYSLLSRTQIPLIPGWAITIHKSQGMTLDSLVVSLDRCFEKGQVYVALSRARSLRGLIVQTLPKPQHMGTDPIVDDFMERTFGNLSNTVATEAVD